VEKGNTSFSREQRSQSPPQVDEFSIPVTAETHDDNITMTADSTVGEQRSQRFNAGWMKILKPAITGYQNTLGAQKRQ
jgi:hypothetical protein